MNLRRFTDTGEWTTRRYLSLLGNILIWVIVAIDAFYLWPTSLQGSTSMVIVSGSSMDPTYFTGDLVIARKMEPSVGDVIVYAPDGFGGSQIVHRIIGGNATDGWVMQGDNNPSADPFTPKGAEIKGVVLVHYANFGRVTVLLLNPITWALFLLAAVVLLLWWSGDTCEDDPEDKDKDNEKRADSDDPEPDAEPDLIDRVVEGTEAGVSRMVAAGVGAGVAALAVLTRPSPWPRHAALLPRRAATAYLRGSAIVAVLGLVAILGPWTASASALTINTGGNIFTKTYTPCTTAALSATPSGTASGSPATTYRELTISGIPASCNSRAITMYAYNSAGIQLISSTAGTTTGTSGTVTFTKSTGYNGAQVAKVYVFIDTWGIQTTWTTPAVPIPNFSCSAVNPGGNIANGQSCTVTNGLVTQWNGGAGNGYQYKKVTFTVTSGMTDFLVTFNFGDSATYGPWSGGVPTRVWSQGQVVAATLPYPGYSCSSLPTVSLNRNLSGDTSIMNFEILVSNDPSVGAGAGYPLVVCP